MQFFVGDSLVLRSPAEGTSLGAEEWGLHLAMLPNGEMEKAGLSELSLPKGQVCNLQIHPHANLRKPSLDVAGCGCHEADCINTGFPWTPSSRNWAIVEVRKIICVL